MKSFLSLITASALIVSIFTGCMSTTLKEQETDFTLDGTSVVLKVEKGETSEFKVKVKSLNSKLKIMSADFYEDLWAPEGGTITKDNITLKSKMPLKVKAGSEASIDYEIAIPKSIPNGIYRGVIRAVSNDTYNTFREIRVELLVTGDSEKEFVTLAENGFTDWKLVVNPNPTPAEKFAAEEFVRCFKAVTGADIDNAESAEKQIVINRTDAGNDGFVIQTSANKVLLSGASDRGTLYAVYSFLEDYLGCKWLDSQTEYLPQLSKAEVPFVDRTDTPVFKYREAYFNDAHNWEFAARNKLNGYGTTNGEEQGGKFTYAAQLGGHTLPYLVPVSEYYDSHPEYFALVEGKRSNAKDAQLCLTNLEMTKVATENVLKWLSEYPDADFISVSQSDNPTYCECENCKTVLEEEGSPSGALLRFVNTIASSVKEKYPDVLVHTFAYQGTRKPPKITKPADNVLIMLCSIECCFGHTYTNCNMDAEDYEKILVNDVNATFLKNLEDWSKIAKNLFVWDYTVNFRRFFMPFPNLYNLNDNIKTIRDNHAGGVFEQGTTDTKHGELAELRAYMISKFLWNPDYPESLAINEFLTAYYRDAAAPIREYVDLINSQPQKVPDIHFQIFDMPEKEFFTDELLNNAMRLMDKAQSLAPNDDKVKIARLPLKYLMLVMQPKETLEEKKALADEYLKELLSYGVTTYGEGYPVNGIRFEIDKAANYAAGKLDSIAETSEVSGIIPIEDSFVRSHSIKYANIPMNSDDPNALCISSKKNDGEVWEGWIFLKFDATDTGGMSSATLALTVHGTQNNEASDVQFNVYKIKGEWDEATLTWNNKPEIDTSKSYGILKYRGNNYARNEQIKIEIDPAFFDSGDGIYSMALVVDKEETPFGTDAAYWSKDQNNENYAPHLTFVK